MAGEDIALRSWSGRHLERLAKLANNPRIAANMADLFPSPYTREEAVRWLATTQAQAVTSDWAIEVGGVLAGGIGLQLRSGPAAHSAALGYWLGEEFWGRGIASVALQLLLERAFGELRLARIDTTVFSWNLASVRVLKKAGFDREGTMVGSFIKDGRIVDRHVYSLLCPDNFQYYESNTRR